MFGLLPQLLIQLLLLKGTHGCYCAKGHWDYAKVKCIIKDKPTTKPVEQTTQRASTRPHRPPKGTTKDTTPQPILTLTSIHIELATWDSWSSCSKSCGTGSKTRSRRCNFPAPAFGGQSCPGTSTSTENCNTRCCPGSHIYTYTSELYKYLHFKIS